MSTAAGEKAVAPAPAATASAPATTDDKPSLVFRVRRYLHVLPFLPSGSTFIFALALLSLLHGAALLLFTRGFLLTRTALPDTNTCDPVSPSGNLDASCSLPPTHDKLIFLVVDALRADFVFLADQPGASPYHHNHLPLPAFLTSERPGHSFLTHFVADAPTTTLQRLKGMTTGSLPTFIDAGSNFAGEQADEDNWLWQARRAGKRLALVGDETWLSVFPRATAGADPLRRPSVWQDGLVWPYSSFDVEDLDTVDRGVEAHLLGLLEPERHNDWDIVVAHGLGLDHAGHRFGAEHAETQRKLRETNRLLERVVRQMGNDTLLVVVGDHGMTDRGDHGGDSRDEVDAALWVFSKADAPLIDPTWFEHDFSSPAHPLATSGIYDASQRASELGDRFTLTWPEKHLSAPSRAVSQIDLVPTLSLLLGLPIPFGSLGVPIPELFFRPSELPVAPTPAASAEDAKATKEKRGFLAALRPSEPTPQPRTLESLSPFQTLLQATLLAASQLESYLLTYTSSASASGADLRPAMPELAFLLSLGKSAYIGARGPGHDQSAMEARALAKFWSFERAARDKARAVWARFDPRLMGAGLAIWAGSLVVAARIASATKRGPAARFLLGRAVEGALLALGATAALWASGAFRAFGGLKGLVVVFAAAAGAELAVIFAPRTAPTLAQSFGLVRVRSLRQFAPLVPLLAHAAAFASNSWTVFEDSLVLFLLTSLLLATLVRALAAPEARLRNRIVGFTAVALVCVRLMATSTICREEQLPRCSPTFYLTPGSTAAQVALAASALCALLVPYAFRSFLALSSADEALAPVFLGLFTRGLLLSGTAYWALDWALSALEMTASTARLAVLAKTGVARVVLVCATLTATLVWRFSPLCIRIQRSLVRNPSTGEVQRTQIQVIGFANALGSSYLLFFAAVFSLLFLVSPPQAQVVLSLHTVVLLCLLEIWDSERDASHLTRSLTSMSSLEAFFSSSGDGSDGGLPPAPPHTGPTFAQVSTLALLAHLAFFATGHQAVISSIQWSTAFIGFPTLTYPFSPLLVILNTLSAFVLTAAALPLFALWNLAPTLPNQGGAPMVVARTLLRTGAYYGAYVAGVGLASAACAAWLRRHLMVWKVFAPRFMLGGVVILATEVVMVLVAMAWGARGVMGKVQSSLGTKMAE
ncbi:hypothetical protein JCM10207_007675 [Rhodosporidiobolus poonsookiae]